MYGWEKALIGSVIYDPQAMASAEGILPGDFAYPPHRLIWAEILALHRRGSLEARAVIEMLRASLDQIHSPDGSLTGEAYFGELVQSRGSAVEEYAGRVLSASIKRSLKSVAGLIRAEAEDERVGAEEVLDNAERRLLSLRRTGKLEEGMTIGDIIAIFLPRFEGLRDGTYQPAWVPHLQALKDLIDYAEDEDYIINAGRPGDGKCLGKGTKVLMFDGTLRAVEDVRVGDRLMGPHSRPRTVLSITRGRGMMYWVRQNRAIDYRVNEHHILSLQRSKNEDGLTHGEIRNFSVHNILYHPMSNRWKGYKVPVRFPEQAVDLEPYFLGLWLGDGTSANSNITNTDQEVIDYLQDYANRRGEKLHSHKLTYRITTGWIGDNARRRNSIQAILRRMGLLNNKHIPNAYLINSKRIRLELLAGLIDSDGHMIHNGIEIVMKNKGLIEQIVFLCNTLGFRVGNIQEKTAKCQTGAEGIAYRISIHGDFTDCPIRIKRKIPDASKKRVDWRMTGFHIEEDKVDDYYGFTLDGNGLFLLEDMTVTHNSTALRYESYWLGKQGVPNLIFNMDNSHIDYARNLLGLHLGIDTRLIKMPKKLSDEQVAAIKNGVQELVRLPIHIVTLGSPDIDEIDRILRKKIAQNGVRWVGIDYIQQVNNGLENKVQDVSKTSAGIKRMGVRYHVPFFANSQLSRAIERRGDDAEPQLADLRDSGSLEQDATMIMFVRPVLNASASILKQFPENANLRDPVAIPLKIYLKKHRNVVSQPVVYKRPADFEAKFPLYKKLKQPWYSQERTYYGCFGWGSGVKQGVTLGLTRDFVRCLVKNAEDGVRVGGWLTANAWYGGGKVTIKVKVVNSGDKHAGHLIYDGFGLMDTQLFAKLYNGRDMIEMDKSRGSYSVWQRIQLTDSAKQELLPFADKQAQDIMDSTPEVRAKFLDDNRRKIFEQAPDLWQHPYLALALIRSQKERLIRQATSIDLGQLMRVAVPTDKADYILPKNWKTGYIARYPIDAFSSIQLHEQDDGLEVELERQRIAKLPIAQFRMSSWDLYAKGISGITDLEDVDMVVSTDDIKLKNLDLAAGETYELEVFVGLTLVYKEGQGIGVNGAKAKETQGLDFDGDMVEICNLSAFPSLTACIQAMPKDKTPKLKKTKSPLGEKDERPAMICKSMSNLVGYATNVTSKLFTWADLETTARMLRYSVESLFSQSNFLIKAGTDGFKTQIDLVECEKECALLDNRVETAISSFTAPHLVWQDEREAWFDERMPLAYDEVVKYMDNGYLVRLSKRWADLVGKEILFVSSRDMKAMVRPEMDGTISWISRVVLPACYSMLKEPISVAPLTSFQDWAVDVPQEHLDKAKELAWAFAASSKDIQWDSRISINTFKTVFQQYLDEWQADDWTKANAIWKATHHSKSDRSTAAMCFMFFLEQSLRIAGEKPGQANKQLSVTVVGLKRQLPDFPEKWQGEVEIQTFLEKVSDKVQRPRTILVMKYPNQVQPQGLPKDTVGFVSTESANLKPGKYLATITQKSAASWTMTV